MSGLYVYVPAYSHERLVAWVPGHRALCLRPHDPNADMVAHQLRAISTPEQAITLARASNIHLVFQPIPTSGE